MFIRKNVWNTASRPCRLSLNLQDACAVADFDIDLDGRVYLVRISFDGHGCCKAAGKATRLPLEESRTLVERFDADDVNREEVGEILFRYFDENQEVIWRDALLENGLLKQ